MPPVASIQIPTWRRKQLLHDLLESLATQTLPPDQYEVLVCDSGSGDGTAEMVAQFSAQHSHLNLRYLDIETNTLSAKRNRMFAQTAAPIVILLDDDLLVCPEFVEAHVSAHRGRQLTLFCGTVRFPPAWFEQSNYYKYRDSRHIGPDRPDIAPHNIAARHVVVMNLSVKKSEMQSIGFMSEDFIKYGCEDHEFGWRVKQAGFSVELAEKAVALHFEGTGEGNGLIGYARKGYTMARYGLPVLHRLAPEVLAGSKVLYLEPPHPRDSLGMKCKKLALKLVLNPLLAYPVQKYLLWTDRVRPLYSPKLYSYLMAASMRRGCSQRKPDDLNPKQASGWL